MVKNLLAMQETWVHSLGGEDPLEKEMATHSSILAWRIPWTEEPGGLQSMESQRVLASGQCCLLLDLECYKPWVAPPGCTGSTLHNSRVLYSPGSQCDRRPLDLYNTTVVLTFEFLRPAGRQAVISTLGLRSTLTSLSRLWRVVLPAISTPFQWLLSMAVTMILRLLLQSCFLVRITLAREPCPPAHVMPINTH